MGTGVKYGGLDRVNAWGWGRDEQWGLSFHTHCRHQGTGLLRLHHKLNEEKRRKRDCLDRGNGFELG